MWTRTGAAPQQGRHLKDKQINSGKPETKSRRNNQKETNLKKKEKRLNPVKGISWDTRRFVIIGEGALGEGELEYTERGELRGALSLGSRRVNFGTTIFIRDK